jgi:dTDP-4-amino-4,6-dideoxygalactose transaminase
VADRVTAEVVSLPLYPSLPLDALAEVTAAVAAFSR